MKSISHTETFQLDQPIDRVFPLFSPEGEKHWVPGWDYDNLMGTIELSEDYVFLTRSHDHASTAAIWLVKRYDPTGHRVQFYKIEPDDKIGIITVQCQAPRPDSTAVQVSYDYRALSATGETFIDSFDQAAYRQFIGEWQSLLVAYFARQ